VLCPKDFNKIYNIVDMFIPNQYFFMKNRLLFIIIIFLFPSFLSAQENKVMKGMPDFLKSVEPYGTLQYALGGNKLGWAVKDVIPRIGIKGEWFFDNNKDYYFFTTAELGLKLSSRDDFVEISADPGASYGQINNALFARQGFIGIGTPYGRISIGKQWGVHYKLASSIDNMYLFGGMAIGVYNAGTDGGISGTGRANQAVKYEFIREKVYFGAQIQTRNTSENNKYFADTYGLASYYNFNGFKLGLSYNKVLDGVEEPVKNEAKINDEFIAILLDFQKGDFHFGILPQVFNNHEKTDENIFYKGWGFESNLKINFGSTKQWSFVNNIAFLQPIENSGSLYLWNRYEFEIARRFSKNTLIVLGFRYDNNTEANGEKKYLHTVAIGFNYNFNYPVP